MKQIYFQIKIKEAKMKIVVLAIVFLIAVNAKFSV